MKVNVRVVPNAKIDSIEGAGNDIKVRLRAPAVEGKANDALVEFLAGHYNVKKRDVRIVKGEKGRHKVVEIDL